MDGISGLVIVDISNPLLPNSVGGYRVSSHDFKIVGNYAYLIEGVSSSDLGLIILDISNPKDIKKIGESGIRGGFHGISISGNYLYTAIRDSPYNRLRVIDISNPVLPATVSTYSAKGDIGEFSIFGNYIYMGTRAGLEVADISDPSEVKFVSLFDSGEADIRINSMTFDGNHMYAGTSHNYPDDYAKSFKKFDIFNISNPSSISLVGSLDHHKHNRIYGVSSVDGDYIYIVSRSGLGAINIKEPSLPRLEVNLDLDNISNRVSLKGDYAYVANREGLSVVKVKPLPTNLNAIEISIPTVIEDTITQDIEKVYKFTLLEEVNIIIDAGETTDVALRGYVYDANGTKVSSIADWSKGKNNQLKIEKVLDAGEYVLKVFASADGDFSMEVKTYVVDPDTAWSAVVKSQYTIHKNKLFTKTFRIEQNTHDANYENLIVTVDGSNDVHLDVQKKDEKGADLEEYRYKLVGTLTDSTDITLNIADSSQSFSISLPVRLKVGDFEIKAVFPNNPMIIANGDDITYPLSVAFDAIVPSGSTVKPTCRITVPWDGSTKTIDLPARQIGDNLQRYKCGMYDHDGNAYYLSVVAHMDEISLDIGFEDIESPYETVTAPVFKRDMVTAKATLEYMHEYEAEALVHSEDTYVIVNQRIYSANAASIPDIIYLGGENALHGTRKFNKDTVFLQGGIWKLTYGGHEVIIETHLDVLLGLGRVSSQLAFTVDGSSDITQNSDVVKFIIDPESTYRMLVKKSPVISRMRRFLSSGQLWQMASTLHSSNIHIDECEIPNSPLSVAQALSFDSHPCVQMNADGNNILAGVRGTTFTIEKKKNKPLVFNLIEGEIELSSTSLEGNITLHDMESLDLNQTVKTSINTNVLTPLQEKYLEDTSLNTADENTSIGSISITTNLSNASYMLVGDNVQAGNGKVSVFENVTEGSYDLQFLPVLGFVTPDNIKIILSKVNLDKQYAVVYKIDTDNDGVTDSIDAFPNDPNESVDTDHDGIGNNADTDDDNDGVLDVNDALPLNPNESVDTDHDGIGNNADKDDDNDGISDVLEVANGLNPLNASDGEADFDNDGFTNSMEISVGTDIRSASSKPVWTPIMMGDIIIFVPAKP